MEDDTEKEELKAYLDIVPGEEFAIDVESLSTKYPIVDWKTHILTEKFMYYQIIRANVSSKNYKIFSEMIDDFDRQDVMDLHRLVKERYVTTSPEGYDLMLWGDLKTLFEPDEEDEVWRNQHGYNLISWRLIDSCGIHILLMDNGISIHMMVEKKYPLIQEMLSKMLNRKLEIDHESEMAFELLRFTRSQLQKELKIYSLGSTNIVEQITANGDTVNTASIDVSVVGPSNVSIVDPSISTAGDIFEDEMMTINDTLVAIRSTRPRTTSVVIRDVEEKLRRATPVPTIQRDAEIAQRLHEEEKVELERMQRERAAQEEASNAALIAEFDNVQVRMETDALFTYNQLKNKSFEEIQKLYEKEQKWIKDFIPMDSEECRNKAASSKKRPRAEPDEERKFDRDDLVKLWDLVKKRFSTTEPTNDKEKELWVKLKRLFEPDNDDIMWKLQRYMHDPSTALMMAVAAQNRNNTTIKSILLAEKLTGSNFTK
ncbi:hypothetical protein Tco_0045220, partial [Tanacetum coccineum]